jgi:hypothetical protein
MRVVDIIRKLVVFIGHAGVNGNFIADGTGFCIQLEAYGFAFPYIITAKHVIDQAAGDQPSRDILLRMNTYAGKIEYIRTKKERWHIHADHVQEGRKQKYIDVAAFCMVNMREWAAIDIENMDFSFLREDDICDDSIVEKYAIGIGDDVVIPGLFHSHVGTQRNIPIVRGGMIAAVREEPVPTSYGLMDAYLVEMRSVGGISGSPVLLQMEGRATVLLPEAKDPIKIARSKKNHYLLGLVHGHYTITTQDEWVFKTNQQVGDINAGIAVIVPWSKIMETINQPSAFGQEQEMARIFRGRQNTFSKTIPDSGPSVGVTNASELGDDANPNHQEDFMHLVNAAARKRPRDDQT